MFPSLKFFYKHHNKHFMEIDWNHAQPRLQKGIRFIEQPNKPSSSIEGEKISGLVHADYKMLCL